MILQNGILFFLFYVAYVTMLVMLSLQSVFIGAYYDTM